MSGDPAIIFGHLSSASFLLQFCFHLLEFVGKFGSPEAGDAVIGEEGLHFDDLTLHLSFESERKKIEGISVFILQLNHENINHGIKKFALTDYEVSPKRSFVSPPPTPFLSLLVLFSPSFSFLALCGWLGPFQIPRK